jgi:hypothetical protein
MGGDESGERQGGHEQDDPPGAEQQQTRHAQDRRCDRGDDAHPRDVADPPQAGEQRHLRTARDAEGDSNGEPADLAGEGRVPERPSREHVPQQPDRRRSGPGEKGGSPEERLPGLRKTGFIATTIGRGDLSRRRVREAEPGNRGHGRHETLKQADKGDAGRSHDQRRGFLAGEAAGYVQERRAANDEGRAENLPVRDGTVRGVADHRLGRGTACLLPMSAAGFGSCALILEGLLRALRYAAKRCTAAALKDSR